MVDDTNKGQGEKKEAKSDAFAPEGLGPPGHMTTRRSPPALMARAMA